jgi:hypothetical protein
MKSLMASLSGISATWDIVLFFCLAAILFFWGISRGKNKIKFVIIALYIGIVLFGALPLNFIDKNLPSLSFAPTHTVVLFVLVLLLLYFLQNIFRTGDNRSSAPIKTLILSFITAGFIMSILVSQISPTTTTFSAFVLNIFYQTSVSWLWNIIPILGVLFL